MPVHQEGEVRREHADEERQLDAVGGRVRRLVGQAHGAEVDVRVAPRDVRVLVVLHVVPVAPALLVDGDVPPERGRAEGVCAFELVVGAMERRVTDLGGLELLVEPQREHAGGERDRLEAEMDERAPGDLGRDRDAAQALHVGDVLGADLRLDVSTDDVDRLAEARGPLGLRGEGMDGTRLRRAAAPGRCFAEPGCLLKTSGGAAVNLGRRSSLRVL